MPENNKSFVQNLIDLIKDSKINLASEFRAGLMSSADKEKLNNLESRLHQLFLEIMADIDFKVSEPVFSLPFLVKGYTKSFTATSSSLFINDPKEIIAFILTIPELNISRQLIYSDFYSEKHLTFNDLQNGQSVTIDGLTLTATGGNITSTSVALAFANLSKSSKTGNTVDNGVWSGSLSENWHSGEAINSDVIFTSENINEDTAFNYSVAGQDAQLPTISYHTHYIGRTTIPITLPLVFDQDAITLRLYAVDTDENRSQTVNQNVLVTTAKVNIPRITEPDIADGEYISYHKGIKVSTSDFDSTIEDTHASTTYKITSDPEGSSLVLNNAEDSINKLSYTFPIQETTNAFTANTDYYIHVRHIGNNLGSSDWSMPKKFRVHEGVATKNGRFVYRHESDRGIVIEWELGEVTKKLFVYDNVLKNTPMLQINPNVTYNAIANTSSPLISVTCLSYSEYGQGNYYHRITTAPFYCNHTYNAPNFGSVNSAIYFISDLNNVPGLTDSYAINNGSDNKWPPVFNTYLTQSGEFGERFLLNSRALCNFWQQLNENNSTIALNYARSITNIQGVDNLDIPSLRELFVILTESNLPGSMLKGDLYNLFVEKQWTSYGNYIESSNIASHFLHANAGTLYIAGFAYNEENNDMKVTSPDTGFIDFTSNENVFTFLVRDITDL